MAAVRRSLEERIHAGRLRPGLRLPPEPELATELGVSRATLREALRGLEEEGLLRRARGAGTFLVPRPRVANSLDQNFGVTEDTSARLEPVPPEEGRRLFLEPGEEVAVIDRVRTADGRPVVLSRDVLPARLLGPRPAAVLRRLERSSIYEVMERQLGVAVHHGVATFAPEAARGEVARRLRVPEGTLLLYLRQVDYDEEGRPALSSHEHHLAEAFEFTVVRRGPGRRSG